MINNIAFLYLRTVTSSALLENYEIVAILCNIICTYGSKLWL